MGSKSNNTCLCMDYLSFSKTHSMLHLGLELIFVYHERKRSSSSVLQVGTRALFNLGQFWPTVEYLLTTISKPCVLRYFFIMACHYGKTYSWPFGKSLDYSYALIPPCLV